MTQVQDIHAQKIRLSYLVKDLINYIYSVQYYLSVQSNPSEGGTISPNSGWYSKGQQVILSASPLSGFHFVEWGGSGTGSYTGSTQIITIIINGPITQVAKFERDITPFIIILGVVIISTTSYLFYKKKKRITPYQLPPPPPPP